MRARRDILISIPLIKIPPEKPKSTHSQLLQHGVTKGCGCLQFGLELHILRLLVIVLQKYKKIVVTKIHWILDNFNQSDKKFINFLKHFNGQFLLTWIRFEIRNKLMHQMFESQSYNNWNISRKINHYSKIDFSRSRVNISLKRLMQIRTVSRSCFCFDFNAGSICDAMGDKVVYFKASPLITLILCRSQSTFLRFANYKHLKLLIL